MERFLRLMRFLTAIAVILSASLLCFQCIDIYASGGSNSTSNSTAIFRTNDIVTRLKGITIPLLVCGAVIIAAMLLHAFYSKSARPEHAAYLPPHSSMKAKPLVHSAGIQALLLFTAIAFILLGVVNGGAYDMLVKAINICTECIGLG